MRRRWGLGALAAAAAIVVAAIAWLYSAGPWCAVDLEARAEAPSPSLAGDNVEAWLQQRSGLRGAFEREVYGPLPAPIEPVVAQRESIAPSAVGGLQRVEQWRVDVAPAGHFHLAIVRPASDAAAPVILTLNFCGNRAAFSGRPRSIEPPVRYVQWFCEIEALDLILKGILGPYANGPPFELITSRGYAAAMLYAGDVVPDGEEHAGAAVARFAAPETGALMAWAWLASRAYDVLAADPRFDAERIAIFGQSRQGKMALIAGAFDERFAAVVALQAGRGGDAPMRPHEGESLEHITRTYPHWFAPRFAGEPPVDQHQLLALIAPRPLLLGHARRDSWADPVGAREMRDAAAPVFRLLGAPPPTFFVRGGGHGIHRADWLATLNFLDARLAP